MIVKMKTLDVTDMKYQCFYYKHHVDKRFPHRQRGSHWLFTLIIFILFTNKQDMTPKHQHRPIRITESCESLTGGAAHVTNTDLIM